MGFPETAAAAVFEKRRLSPFSENRGSRHFGMLRHMGKLTPADVHSHITDLSNWTLEGDAIRRQFTFASFPDAIAFVCRLAFEAESVDHHPDILINYKRVTLTYTTHSEGGLTRKDFDGARTADALASHLSR
jgi:4a-hydroxytetrahydrobiopterin dehydratase